MIMMDVLNEQARPHRWI